MNAFFNKNSSITLLHSSSTISGIKILLRILCTIKLVRVVGLGLRAGLDKRKIPLHPKKGLFVVSQTTSFTQVKILIRV
jgi:hypothetical protein